MARSILQKSHQLDESVLAGAARLRARVLELVHGALRESECDQVTLANRLGVRKAAVNGLLRGNGNVRVNTLAEYMAALGYEIDMTAVPLGEIERALEERRGPRYVVLTMADQDRNRHEDDHTITVYSAAIRSGHWPNLDEPDHPRWILEYAELMKDGYARKIEAARG